MYNRNICDLNYKRRNDIMPTKGKNNEKINRKPLDFILCIVIFLLLALGIVMVLSASAPSSLSQYR